MGFWRLIAKGCSRLSQSAVAGMTGFEIAQMIAPAHVQQTEKTVQPVHVLGNSESNTDLRYLLIIAVVLVAILVIAVLVHLITKKNGSNRNNNRSAPIELRQL